MMQTVLSFSGGRDSAIAAVELGRTSGITLVTVSSGHLHGVSNVHERLHELACILPPETPWLRIRSVELPLQDLNARTCLPCQCVYAATALAVARHIGANQIGFGYAAYQSSWPEQTPDAIDALRTALAGAGIQLVLPVHRLSSKEGAKLKLQSLGLSADALEQKCSKQVNHETLSSEALAEQVQRWMHLLSESFRSVRYTDLEILEHCTLGSLPPRRKVIALSIAASHRATK